MYQLHVTHVDIKDNGPIARHVLIKLIGLSMVSLFMPVILMHEYQLSLPMIFLFEALFSLFVLVLTYFFSLEYTARVGTVASMFIGVIGFIGNFIVLYGAKFFPWLLILSPFFAAWYVSFFRVGYHTSRSLLSQGNKSFGTQNSGIESVALLAGLIGPVLGGFLADTWGSTVLYIVVGLCLCLSCIPFFFHQQMHKPFMYSPNINIKRIAHNKKYYQSIIASFGATGYLYFVGSVVWSLIMFETLGTYTKLALISFGSGLFLLVVFYYLGKLHDRHDKKTNKTWIRYLQWSFWGQSGTWLFATILLISGVFSQFFFLLIDTLHKISYKVTDLGLMTSFYETMGKESTIQRMLDVLFIREVAIHGSKIIICLILAGLTAYLHNAYQCAYQGLIFALFSVLLIAPLGMHFIKRKQENEKNTDTSLE